MKTILIIFNILFFTVIASAQWGVFQKTSPVGFISDYSDYNYGYSIDIDGNYAVVGARGANTSTGVAYVLYYNGTSWLTQATLKASDGLSFDYFGSAVAISGNVIVVGAYNDGQQGSVYVFERPTTGWSGNNVFENAKLTSSMPETDEYFGRSIDIQDSVIVVGAYGDNQGKGSVYVFEEPVTGWASGTQTAKLKSSVEQDNDYFGKSVAIFDTTIVIGAYRDDYSTFTDCGSVYIFTRKNSEWVSSSIEDYKITASDKNINDQFGRSVSIYDNTIIVGAYGKNANQGVAYIFEYNTNWQQMGKLIPSDGNADDYFGISTSIYGDTVLIGAYTDDPNGISDAGAAYIFKKPISGWTDMNESQKISANDAATSDNFGISVCINQNHIGVGAYLDDDQGTESGSVYWFNNCQPTSSTIVENACIEYISPSGNYTWSSTGIYQDTILNSTGCDSIITINLSIYQASSSTQNITSCEFYTSPSGNYTWLSSGNYKDTIPNVHGCDSVITFNLNIQDNNISLLVSQNGSNLVSNQNNAISYQWLDCNDNFNEITGATNQQYIATTNGSFAVEITDGICIDTSYCYNVTTVDIVFNAIRTNNISIFPNPTDGHINISGSYIKKIEIINSKGQIIKVIDFNKNQTQIDMSKYPKGMYQFRIISDNRTVVKKIIFK